MSDYEQWVLDGLALNDATFTLEQLSAPVPTKIAEWIKGADSDGAILARPPKHENRVIEMAVRVIKQTTMDLAIAKLGLVLNKLQECEQNENGLALAWTPADASTVAAATGRCLMGEIVDLPIDWEESGWMVYSPKFTIRLTCLPFFEGTESLLGTVTSSDPIITREVSAFAGDAPGKGRIVVTDAATQSRRWLVWGLESRWYPTSSPPSLLIDSASLVTTGYAGVTATRSGAYSGASNNVIRATLQTQAQAICGLGNLSHIGQFRPQLRFYADSTTIALRLTYQTLDGPSEPLVYRLPVTIGWNHLDLGLVTIPPTTLGTQRWTGRIEAYSTATGGETLDVDFIALVPAERCGRGIGSYAYYPGLLLGRDDFTGSTAGAVLHGRTAPTGGTWATSGSTTDFTTEDVIFAPGGTMEVVTRSTTGDATPRFAILGSTDYTDVEVGARIYSTDLNAYQVLILRWADSNNQLRVMLQGGVRLIATKKVAGVAADIARSAYIAPLGLTDTWFQLRCVLFASGRGVAWLLNDSGAILLTMAFFDTALATGGALATGKPGLGDFNPSAANSRYYDDFYAATPTPEPIVIHSGQSLEVRSDSVLREDSTGTYAGPPPGYVGSYFTIPPAGGPGRKARIAVMAKRNNVETTADDYIADSTTVDVYGTPRYLAIPR